MSAPGSFVPSAAFKAALFAVIARSIAAQTANGNPVKREGSEDDGEIDIRLQAVSGPSPLARLLAAGFCDDPACEACTAARSAEAAAEARKGSPKPDASKALIEAAAALSAASEAIERAAKAVALATPERG